MRRFYAALGYGLGVGGNGLRSYATKKERDAAAKKFPGAYTVKASHVSKALREASDYYEECVKIAYEEEERWRFN